MSGKAAFHAQSVARSGPAAPALPAVKTPAADPDNRLVRMRTVLKVAEGLGQEVSRVRAELVEQFNLQLAVRDMRITALEEAQAQTTRAVAALPEFRVKVRPKAVAA